MKKICVIGNSHAGAIKLSNRYALSRQLSLSFFVMSGRYHPYLIHRNGRLYAKRPENVRTDVEGWQEGLGLSPFDAVVISAWGLPNTLDCIAARTHPLMEGRLFNWGLGENSAKLISRAVMKEVIKDRLMSLPPLETIDLVATLFSGPLIVQPKPLPGLALLDDTEWPVNAMYDYRARTVYSDYAELHQEASAEIFGLRRRTVTLLPIPDASLAAPGFASDIYSASSRDILHKNGAYGELVIDQIARALA